MNNKEVINVTAGVERISRIPGCERIDRSTLRNHCNAGHIVGAYKDRSQWLFTIEALDNWQREYYRPRAPYTRWMDVAELVNTVCPHCGGKVFQTEDGRDE